MRREAAISREGKLVHGLVQVSPYANTAALRMRLEALGAEIESWPDKQHMVAVRIPSSKLIELGNVDDVVYVEGGDQYSLP